MLRRLLGPGYYLTASGCIVVLLVGLAVPEALALVVGEAGVDSLVLGALVGLACLYGLVDEVDDLNDGGEFDDIGEFDGFDANADRGGADGSAIDPDRLEESD